MTSLDDIDFDNIEIKEVEADLNGGPPKRTRKPRSDKGQPRGTRSSGGPRGTAALADKLLVPWGAVGMGLSQAVPLVGAVWIVRGESSTRALVDLAKTHPKMLAALNKLAIAGPASELAQTGLMLGLALAMEMGRVAPDSPLAQKLRFDEAGASMTDAYFSLHPEKMEHETSGEQFPYSQPPDSPFSAPGFGTGMSTAA